MRARKTAFYDELYRQQNYFHYQSWIYQPYISSLISYSELRKGAFVLDVGCGQGFFSHLFHKCGMRVHGVDLSEAGIGMAQAQYGAAGITFDVADVEVATFREQFDCVFVRSCSLYNTETFPLNVEVTRNLVRHLKVGGVFIFVYNSNFSGKQSPTWRYHSLTDLTQHFRGFQSGEIFFLNKLSTYILREYSFTKLATRLNSVLSKQLGVGGDLVYILKNLQPA